MACRHRPARAVVQDLALPVVRETHSLRARTDSPVSAREHPQAVMSGYRVLGVNVEVTPLPGIGTRQDFATRAGRRIGVISHRDGKFDLIVTRQDDPGTSVASIPLAPEEAATLAGLLGGPQLVVHLSEQHRDVNGITTHQLPVTAFANHALGDTALRTRTGASIVAVLRSGVVHASPGPEFVLQNGDLAVVVGTTAGLEAAAEILTSG
nr:hypothetical protein [uncultured bacterium]